MDSIRATKPKLSIHKGTFKNYPFELGSIKEEIITKGSLALPYPRSGRSIIIRTNLALLSGLAEIQGCAETSRIKVVVNVEHFLRQILSPTIQLKQENINSNFVHSEQVAVRLRLEQLIGNCQDQCNNLKLSHRKTKIDDHNDALLLPRWGEVTGRKDIKIAKLMRYSTNTYYCFKQIYRYRIQELTRSVDDNKISIVAAKIANPPRSQQLEPFEKYLRLHLKQSITGVPI